MLTQVRKFNIYKLDLFKKELNKKQGSRFNNYNSIDVYDYDQVKHKCFPYRDKIRGIGKDECLIICNYWLKSFNEIRNDIVIKLCEYWNVDLDYLKQKSRDHEIVYKRQILEYILKKYRRYSLTGVGIITNRHHATIRHSIETVENYLETDKAYKEEFDRILDYIEIN